MFLLTLCESNTTLNKTNNFNPDQCLCGLIMHIFFLTSSLSLLLLSQVICRLLSLPEDYWRRVLTLHTDQISSSSSTNKTNIQEDGHGELIDVISIVS